MGLVYFMAIVKKQMQQNSNENKKTNNKDEVSLQQKLDSSILFSKYKTDSKMVYSRNRDFKEWTMRYRPNLNHVLKKKDSIMWQNKSSTASAQTTS